MEAEGQVAVANGAANGGAPAADAPALDGPGYLDEPPGLVTDDELDDEDQDWGANFDGAPMMDINLNMEQVPHPVAPAAEGGHMPPESLGPMRSQPEPGAQPASPRAAAPEASKAEAAAEPAGAGSSEAGPSEPAQKKKEEEAPAEASKKRAASTSKGKTAAVDDAEDAKKKAEAAAKALEEEMEREAERKRQEEEKKRQKKERQKQAKEEKKKAEEEAAAAAAAAAAAKEAAMTAMREVDAGIAAVLGQWSGPNARSGDAAAMRVAADLLDARAAELKGKCNEAGGSSNKELKHFFVSAQKAEDRAKQLRSGADKVEAAEAAKAAEAAAKAKAAPAPAPAPAAPAPAAPAAASTSTAAAAAPATAPVPVAAPVVAPIAAALPPHLQHLFGGMPGGLPVAGGPGPVPLVRPMVPAPVITAIPGVRPPVLPGGPAAMAALVGAGALPQPVIPTVVRPAGVPLVGGAAATAAAAAPSLRQQIESRLNVAPAPAAPSPEPGAAGAAAAAAGGKKKAGGKKEDKLDKECMVCFEVFGATCHPVLLEPCNHANVCEECITDWFKRTNEPTCPKCVQPAKGWHRQTAA